MQLPLKGLMYEATAMSHGQGPQSDARRMPCSDIELNAMECLEAYGTIKGHERCSKYFEDLTECKHARLRLTRYYIMRQERIKKVLKGEIPWANRWGKPYPYESYICGTFFP